MRRGKKDNYWSMGIPGPAGPCSEIYYDRGPEYGPEGGPEVDEDRYLEFWNLVFMQYEIADVKSKEDFRIVGELPAKNIDTGMGLERMASILQGVDNLYEIDEVRPILDKAAEMTGKALRGQLRPRRGRVAPRRRTAAGHRRPRPHLADAHRRRRDAVQRGPRLRAAADRAPGDPGDAAARLAERPGAAGAAAGGARLHVTVLPGAGRGLRAASRRTRTARRRRSCTTLRAGTTILDTAIAETKKARKKKLSGDKAFQLHDTYGFPIDLTLEIAAEAGPGGRRRTGFRKLMARAAAAGEGGRGGAQDRPRRPVGVPVACSTRAGRSSSPGTPRRRASRRCGRCSVRPGRSTAAGEGDDDRARPRRDPVLRRGRRPAARHRPHHGRRRPDRGLRRPADRCPG